MGSGLNKRSEQYRILAEDHERRARAAKSVVEKAELMRKANAYRELAETEDWLEGVPPKPQSESDRSEMS
jgi:hypothetical protein